MWRASAWQSADVDYKNACAVETLHDQLRDFVDLMGIGLGGQRADTVAEEGTAVTKDQPKDIGDVRSAPHAMHILNIAKGLPSQCPFTE